MSVLSSIVILIIMGTLHYTTGSKCPCANKFEKSCIAPCDLATYDEIVDLPNHPNVLLIDVRRPEELVCTGSIPTSINIQIKNFGDLLQLSPEEFESKYGRKKPALDDLIIFTCLFGNGSALAAAAANDLGFTNVKNYIGSWLEYAEKNCLPLECL